MIVETLLKTHTDFLGNQSVRFGWIFLFTLIPEISIAAETYNLLFPRNFGDFKINANFHLL